VIVKKVGFKSHLKRESGPKPKLYSKVKTGDGKRGREMDTG
jgi:hypothetical protein